MNGPHDELALFRRDPDEGSKTINATCRPKFIRWGLENHSINGADLEDIFQNAFILMMQNIQAGRLIQLTGTLCTYLFGVGKNLIRAFLRRHKRTNWLGDDPLPDTTSGAQMYTAEAGMMWQQTSDTLWQEVDALGDPGRSILILTYREGLSAQEIADVMGYASAEVVRQLHKRARRDLLLLKARKVLDKASYEILFLSLKKDMKDHEIAQKLGLSGPEAVQKRRMECMEQIISTVSFH
ncbi:MAG: sigma-70 family RNA polymerase sigma factor [Bacteroidetes bacterium]|nr:sigma-70 family RNA polymerase sigma factor [Bacteroidota bacterium]